ncbi:tRNA (guanine(37)-N1)-methyltransferase-like isoform X2 [Dreissena polymorpha]|nr:tRNA (guanine(37)-N1)-methyltransferase-like isoform X2 [Dreissena polymorpha]
MELMAGQENYVTQTKENGCTFELDYSKVYWNSRLGTEHERIVKGIESTEVVFDVFAGIGPFAIPAAKKGATVFANDLNPHSYEALVNNSKLNKCKNNINCFNLDGREFVKTIIKCELTKLFIKTHTIGDTERNFKVTIIMNLPALAYTFLDAFRSLLEEDAVSVSAGSMPLVHCYCFTDIESAVKDCDGDTVLEVKRRTRGVIGGLNDDDITVRLVRNVAPQKDMVCVSFRLTPDILLNRQDQIDGSLRSENGEPAQKIARLETSTSL